MKENDTDLAIRIPGLLKEHAQEAARQNSRTLSSLIRYLLEQYLYSGKPPVYEQAGDSK
jgi:predicted DNA-binding protein